MENSNLEQVLDGPLNLHVSPLVKLVPLSNQPLSNITYSKKKPYKFMGQLEIRNRGRQLVVYKMMSKQKIDATSGYGFVEPNETKIVNVYHYLTNVDSDNSENVSQRKELSMLILATSCKVIETAYPTDLAEFWHEVRVGNGSRGFIEVLKVKLFYDRPIEASSNALSLADNENDNVSINYLRENYSMGFGSSSSSSCHPPSPTHPSQERITNDSEGSGDCSSSSTRLAARSVAKMSKLSRKMMETHRSVRKIYGFVLFALLVVYLVFIQKNLRKVEADIYQAQRSDG